jgi:hypothetical protein
MTEADWWAATGPYEWPHRLFNWLFYFAGASDRKLRLSCVASVRSVEQFAGGGPFPPLLRLIEAFADGKENEDQAKRAVESVESWQHDRSQTLSETDNHPTLMEEVEENVQRAILNAGTPYFDREWHQSRKRHPYPCHVAEYMRYATALLGQQDVAERTIIHVLHDIFGPLPFRDIAIAPAWLTSDVTALAKGIYDERAFDRMPILADALQDAGCDNDDVLNHCRATQWEHVRGCWVIDLLLGKPWREQAS